MKRILLLSAVLLCIMSNVAWAQRTVSGTVSEEDGNTIPGVNVVLKGTSNGTTSNIDGTYRLSIPEEGGTLVFSFIGLATQEVEVGSRSVVNVTMQSDVQQLTEVVVTALGIERDKESLGYATQEVAAENLRVARETNINTALAGKIAGVQIVSGSGAKFGAPVVRIRGIRGLSGNSPLYVLDGIVVQDPSSINMDNIANLNVLKGANAAALYGNRARDGVVILTSKKGVSKDQVSISLNQTTMFEKVYILPEYQNEYGGGYSQDFATFNYDPSIHDAGLAGLDGMPMTEFYADESWGPKLDGRMVAQWDAFTKGTAGYGQARPWNSNPDNVRDFFRTGVTNTTGVTVSKSGDKYNLNTTITRSARTGVMENTDQEKLYFNLGLNANLTDKLELVAAANYNKTSTFGNLFEGYNSVGSNVNQWFQRQLDIDLLKKYYQMPDGSYTSWNINSPTDPTPLYWDNPYTTVYANSSEWEKQVYSAKFALNYEIIDGLKVSLQATRDAQNYWSESRTASGTLNLSGYSTSAYDRFEDNIQGMLSYNKRFGETLSLVANAGVNFRTNNFRTWNMGTSGGLSVDNLFNISASVDQATVGNYVGQSKVNSYFGQISLGFRDFLYFDGTLRADYDSKLPNGNNAFIYPSTSVSFVFSELVDLSFLSYGKLRGGYARVGSEVDPYSGDVYRTQLTYPLGIAYDGNAITSVPNRLIDPTLEPATTSSQEIGLELGFLNNRLKTDFSYYYQDNSNEPLDVTIPASSGGSVFLTNSVESHTKGWELSIGGTPVKSAGGFNWDVNFNIAQNTTVIDNLGYGDPEEDDAFALSNGFRGTSTVGGWGGIQAVARENAELGVIVGRKFRRDDDGNIVVNTDGTPLYDDGEDLGQMLPDFTGGMFNRFSYKNFEMSFTIDYQFGGMFHSISRMFGAYSGLTAETVGTNDKGNPIRDSPETGGGLSFGGVYEDGSANTTYLAADEYWKSLFALHEAWMYDMTFIKMREIRVGYNFPASMLDKTGVLKGASIALVANNPWLIHSNVDGIDPSEISGDSETSRNNGAWVESGNLPGTRSFGFDLKLKF
ncbi:SusC/RagA family TonB-linked outer membrane protein [Marinoscillum pacificum]|uniref:SusC/RagA family TonB-linked outer membrane protein n=1 Tax=Marinoscillum pacificum TaxID=392723 RepID=UPI00215808A1|nr:SusC/RagA family TonB-linked outer membrane protein [Marinoscillum pacificum]